MSQIAIIGFGFSGLMKFFYLTQNSSQNKIIIFDKNGIAALGPAFEAISPYYLLNVAANKMSAFVDDEKHFYNFLVKNYPELATEIGENGFAPRFIYGRYLQEIRAEAFANATKNLIEVCFISQEVVEVKSFNAELLIKVKNGEFYKVSEINIATSFKQKELKVNFNSKKFIQKLWSKEYFYFHDLDFFNINSDIKKIALIGSGLTALDVIASLKERNFQGKVFIISRHGNFPKKHFALHEDHLNFISPDDAKKGISFLLKKIRIFLRQNPQYDLRHVIDSVRDITVQLWHNFDERSKKLFLYFFAPYWNIFRHRAPVSSLANVKEMLDSGRLEVVKSSVKKLEFFEDKFFIKTKSQLLEVNCVVNCLGFEMDAQKYPLFAQMISEGLLYKDHLMCNSLHYKIHLLGSLNVGRDFEVTSVPDLRKFSKV